MTGLPELVKQLGDTSESLFVVDSNRRIRLWSKGAEALLGYPRSEVLGHRCHEVIRGRSSGGKAWCHADCRVQRAVTEGRAISGFPLRARCGDGREIDLAVGIIVLSRHRKPLTVHLIRGVSREDRDHRTIQRILRVVSGAGYPDGGAPDERRTASQRPQEGAGINVLSKREVQVLSMLAGGESPVKIAQELGVSVFTVRNHIRNALGKLGLHTRTQAVAYAYKNGLI